VYPKEEIDMNKPRQKGSQPEALAEFAKSARSRDGKPDKPGLYADRESAAIPTDPKLKQDAATRVIREGVLHRDEGADEAIDRLPDRISKK
jgi:hypothetical protein